MYNQSQLRKQLQQQRKFDTSTTQYRSTYYQSLFALIVSLGVITYNKNGFLKTMPILRPPVYSSGTSQVHCTTTGNRYVLIQW